MIASSTTSPIASTNANSDSVLIENPSNGNTAKVPISETGTAITGIKVARQFCRNRNTTMITRTIASSSVVSVSFMPSLTGRVVSNTTTESRSAGKRCFNSAIVCLRPLAVASAFEPGD